MRAGFGLFYGPGQFEDRIQPIENYIDRSRVQASDVPANTLAYPVDPATIRNLLSIRGYTHDYPNEYNMQYGVSLSRELPGAFNLTVGYTGSKGYDMFLRGVGNVLDPVTRVRARAELRAGRLQDRAAASTASTSLGIYPTAGCGHAKYDALQVSLTRRFRSGFSGGLQYQYSVNKGTTQGSNEAGRRRTRSTSTPSTAPTRRTSRTRSTARWSISSPVRACGRAAGASAASSTPGAACRSTSPSRVRTTSRSTA